MTKNAYEHVHKRKQVNIGGQPHLRLKLKRIHRVGN